MGTNGVGFILSIFMLIGLGVWTVPDDPIKLLDAHSFVTVFIGTAVITLISVPIDEAKLFFRMIRVVSRKELDDRPDIINLFVEMASTARTDITKLAQFKERISDPFFVDATMLLAQDINAKSLIKILHRRLEVQKERENSHAHMFKNLGKYPPACGLMGTVMGMIALLGTLGQEGAAENIGPAMSVALGATLYGVILANIVILPVADNLLSRTQKSIAKREMIVEGIMMLRQKMNPVMIREMLFSHVPPGMRETMENGGGK